MVKFGNKLGDNSKLQEKVSCRFSGALGLENNILKGAQNCTIRSG